MQRRRRYWHGRTVLAGAAAALAVTSVASSQTWAATPWTLTVHGAGVGESATMPAGQTPTATLVQTSITIAWGPSTFGSGKEVAGYIVSRQAVGSTDVTKVCTVAAPLRSCQDSPPAGQQVTYSIVPTAGPWQGPASPPSAPVTVTDPPSLSPSPAASPSASPSLTPNPSPSPSPTPSSTPTPTPTATPSASPT